MPGQAARARSLGCFRLAALWGLSLLMATPVSLASQPEQPSEPPPEKTDPAPAPSAPDADQTRRRNDAADEGLAPTREPPKPAPAARPAAPSTAIPVPRARRAREGVFIVKQAGELLMARTGDVIFVPDKDAPVRTSRPMVLLPCQALARLESAAGLRAERPTADGDPRPRVLLTGQIMVYRQREYILPTVFQIEPPEPELKVAPAAPSPPTQPSSDDDASSPTGDNRDRDVEAFITELEDRRTRNRGLTRDLAEAPAAPAASSQPEKTGADAAANRAWSIPEGSVITARRGRLVRLVDGAVGISFDNGISPANAARRTEAPMALQPCQLTQRMEDVVGGRGDTVAIELSGRVFSYGGQTYLLPTMYKILPPAEVGPLN
ncbi:MAG: hypothetical protein GIKADHBN_03513 [Phycisphaerales bacterium]|nr:hypothetical protein [Phycisphaerales bacterium]